MAERKPKRKKLTEEQWKDIEVRYICGDSARKLGKEFHIPESTIRGRVKDSETRIKPLAEQIITNEREYESLSAKNQEIVDGVVATMRSISENMLVGSAYGAETFKHLSFVAYHQAKKISRHEPDMETLKTVRQIKTVCLKIRMTFLICQSKSKQQNLPDFFRPQ
jgi:hypothetical protein